MTMESAKDRGASVIPHHGAETQHGIHDAIDKVPTPRLIGQEAAAITVLVARLDRLWLRHRDPAERSKAPETAFRLPAG